MITRYERRTNATLPAPAQRFATAVAEMRPFAAYSEWMQRIASLGCLLFLAKGLVWVAASVWMLNR